MLITLKDAAKLLGVSVPTLRAAIHSGVIHAVILRKRYFIPISEVERIARTGERAKRHARSEAKSG